MVVSSRRIRFSLLSAFVACVFAGYLVTLTPHLVHHLFDGDHDQPRCPHLAQSEHTPEAGADPGPSLSPVSIGRVAALPERTSLALSERITTPSRAPPAARSLA